MEGRLCRLHQTCHRHVSTSTIRRLVFVGYGVDAPEFHWDDYKGVDVKGKTLVMLVNDPPVPDPARPDGLDPKMFGGKAMTYYGRWTYKYREGSRDGRGRRLDHPRDRSGRVSLLGLQSNGASIRSRHAGQEHEPRRRSKVGLQREARLMAMAGQDFDALKQQARDSRLQARTAWRDGVNPFSNKLRTVDSQNVDREAGRQRTRRLKDEYVVFRHIGTISAWAIR